MKTVSWQRVFSRALIFIVIGVAAGALQARESFWNAIKHNDHRAVRDEVGRGVDPNLRHPELGPAIVYAARERALDVVRLLAILKAVDVEATNRSDETALMLVALHGDLATVRFLVERAGAQVNRPGWTPLHYAATGGHEAIVLYLLERHAFIDAQSPNGTSPLMLAARMNFPSVARRLVEEGADPTLRNQAGFDAAAYLEHVNRPTDAAWMREHAMQYLLRYGTLEQARRTSEGGVQAGTVGDGSGTASPAAGLGIATPSPPSAAVAPPAGFAEPPKPAATFSAIPMQRDASVDARAAPLPVPGSSAVVQKPSPLAPRGSGTGVGLPAPNATGGSSVSSGGAAVTSTPAVPGGGSSSAAASTGSRAPASRGGAPAVPSSTPAPARVPPVPPVTPVKAPAAAAPDIVETSRTLSLPLPPADPAAPLLRVERASTRGPSDAPGAGRAPQ